MIVCGCSASKQIPVYINCNQAGIELFVNGEYIGSGGPFPYTIANGQQTIEIEGRKSDSGNTLFVRTYYAPFKKNSLIEIQYNEPMFNSK